MPLSTIGKQMLSYFTGETQKIKECPSQKDFMNLEQILSTDVPKTTTVDEPKNKDSEYFTGSDWEIPHPDNIFISDTNVNPRKNIFGKYFKN